MKPPLPNHAQIEPTTLCNLKCRSCINEGLPSGRKGHLSLVGLKKIIEGNRFLSDVSLLGLGEPLMNPELAGMAEYLFNEGIKTRTCTNGMLIDRVDLPRLLPSIDELIISLDAADPDLLHEIRTGADFNRIIKNVERVVSIKTKRGLPLVVSFQAVVSRMNIDKLDSIPRLARELGIDKVRFSWAVQYNPAYENHGQEGSYREIRERIRSMQENKFDAKLENRLRNELKSLCDQYGLQFSFAGSEPRFRDCWWPGKGFYMTYDGYVTPCCMRMDPLVFNFGNLFDQTFDEIQKGEKYVAFINGFRQNSCPDICGECPL